MESEEVKLSGTRPHASKLAKQGSPSEPEGHGWRYTRHSLFGSQWPGGTGKV
jgi:hypothetical protein